MMKHKQPVKEIKNATGKLDILKWGIVVVLFLMGFFANYYYIQQPLSLRLIGWVILASIMAAIAFHTSQGHRLWKFFREAHGEMKKVVWPNRRETFQTTMLVITIVVIFSLLIWIVDVFLMWIVNWLTGQM
jgi:preprotein translocase subunit SecE